MRVRAVLLALVLSACVNQHPAVADSTAIEAFYPEGPLWQGETLYFAEMGADRISTFQQGQARPYYTERGCGPTALAPYGDGFLVLCHVGARVVSIDAQAHAVRTWAQDDSGVRLMDPNDAFADGRGGVYFSDPGAFSRDTRPHGRVMHLSASGELKRVAGPLWYPNGVFVDRPHNRLYVTEHMTGHVLRYDIRDDATLSGPSVFIDLANVERPTRYSTPYAETGPDGLEIGPDGDLWVSLYGEGRILRFSPQGRLVGMIEEPTRYLTNISLDTHGNAATTGTFDNLNAPFPGEVRFHPAATLTRAPE